VGQVGKGEMIEARIQALPKYQQELIRNLMYGSVAVPKAWLAHGDAPIMALAPEAQIDAAQQLQCAALLEHGVLLVSVVISSLIEEYIHRLVSRHGPLSRPDLDALRRGRGPNRVRDQLFQHCPSWPADTMPQLSGPG
jgi:hypothetical protein